MSQPAARLGDMHICPKVEPGPVPHVGGPLVQGSPNVIIGVCPPPVSVIWPFVLAHPIKLHPVLQRF
jgi:hypothetical protein